MLQILLDPKFKLNWVSFLFVCYIYTTPGFPCGSVVKNLPAKQEA